MKSRKHHRNGYLVVRPLKNHPNIDHWNAVKEARRLFQTNEQKQVYCATCEVIESDYAFEGHHRHYSTFGHESVHDIVLLCISCHDIYTAHNRKQSTIWNYQEECAKLTPSFKREDVPTTVKPVTRDIEYPKQFKRNQ